jgi:serine protease Do
MDKLQLKAVIIACIAGIFLISGISWSLSTDKNGDSQQLTSKTFVSISKEALPAVVSIDVKKKLAGQKIFRRRGNPNKEDLKKYFDDRGSPHFFDDDFLPFFLPFFEEGEIEIPASGSGIIIRPDGYIVTNYHVVANAKQGEITVRLNDDITIEGQDVNIIGEDQFTDLAVLKINTEKKLTALDFADSDELEIGEWVLGLGSPLELKGSVTQGIISAKHRVIGKAVIEDLIQTTAVINPGNSGGPLINLDGKIVGINTAIASNTGRWQGVGFAIPSNTVKTVCESIIESGKAKRGWLGIHMSELTTQIRNYYDLKDIEGIIIAKVVKDSPAEKAGIKAYDLITAVDDKEIKTMVDMLKQIAPKAAGSEVTITLYRLDGKKSKEKKIKVILGERPADDELEPTVQEALPEKSLKFEDLGLKFKEKDPDSTKEGLEVEEVKKDSPTDKAGLRSGDVLIEINRQRINNPEDFRIALKKAEKERDHIVMYQRDNQILFSTIEHK